MSTPTLERAIPGRARDLGDGFQVRRVLPAPQRMTVGPFIFFDHMGPVQLAAGHGMDVRPHPHIGLATVTWLFDGEVLHRDSLGSEQLIRPGELNWMTAGRGIVHSERSPTSARASGAHVHGLQLWVALPDALEAIEPAFQHVAADALPEVDVGGARLRVLAGSAYGVESPAQVHSPLFYVDARLAAGADLELPMEHTQRALYLVGGAVACDGTTYGPGTMLVFQPGVAVRIRALEATHMVLLGGAPIGQRHIWWNFVASTAERIEAAKAAWRAGGFPSVPGDTAEFIPLPEDFGRMK